MSILPTDGPNPLAALDRVLAWRHTIQRKSLRVAVWCENRHTPVRVFKLSEGLLVQCQSDAYTPDAQNHGSDSDWSPRRAFFLDEWLSQPIVLVNSHLQVVCPCAQVDPQPIDVRLLASHVPPDGEPTRNLTIPDVAAQVR